MRNLILGITLFLGDILAQALDFTNGQIQAQSLHAQHLAGFTIQDCRLHSPTLYGERSLMQPNIAPHENISTTSQIYGELEVEAKRQIQNRLVSFVTHEAQMEDANGEQKQLENTHIFSHRLAP